MIAQALRNFRASAGKHLSLVIVNADCQPREKECSSAIHKAEVLSFEWGAAISNWHLASGSCSSGCNRPRCFSTCAGEKTIRSAGLKLETGNCSYPPPTKCTSSRRSSSLRVVSGHCERETISRLSSTATRSPFIPSCSISSASDRESAKLFSSPLMNKRIRDSYKFQVTSGDGLLQSS